MSGTSTRRDLLTKVDGLQIELEEARETLQAIIRGEADSIMVYGPEGARVFTLRDAHHPYRVLVETMNEGAVTLTADADILYSNSSFARIVDAPLEKVLGSSLLDYIAPADAAPLRALLKNGLERQAKAELQVVTSAGRFVPVYFSVSPTALETAPGICLVATDLSAQRQAERVILESINEAFCSFDPGFRFTFANSEAERMFGRQRHELIGESLWEWPDTKDTSLESQLRRVMKDRAPLTFEYFYPSWKRWFEIKACPTSDGGITGSFRDISTRKRAEEEVHRLNLELEQRVQARTFELMAANQELEAFSYSVSHDLRAPLRVIDGFSRTLVENHLGQLNPEGQHRLQCIQEATHRMRQLIECLLELSHAGRTAMNVQEVDLSAAVARIAEELNFSSPERNARFAIADGLKTRGDSRLLRVALENLIRNAWKFTSKHPEARIEFGLCTDEAGSPAYFVRDNGAGFDMRYADKLFGVFQRLHSQAEYEGSGVGLAIAQRIVQRHGGRIWAEAKPDEGAMFYFTIGDAVWGGEPRQDEPTEELK